MNAILRLSLKLYRGLVQLYPAELQRRFGSEMVDVFEQQLLWAWQQRGAIGIGRVWCCVFVEVATEASIPGLTQTAIIPAASVLLSFGLFLVFVWAAGFAKTCG
jgi:hypothetical protein